MVKILELNLETCNKQQLLDELSRLVAEVEGCDNQVVYNDYMGRETEYSTGLENGFAIPHCRTQVNNTYVIIGKINDGVIDYKTLDGSLVQHIISFIVPSNPEGEQEHLRLLANVMRLLVNPQIQEELKNTTNLQEKIRLLNLGE